MDSLHGAGRRPTAGKLRDACRLVIRLTGDEHKAITARWQNEGGDLGLSTWARRVLLGCDGQREMTVAQLLVKKLTDIDILDKNDKAIQRFIQGDGHGHRPRRDE